MPMKNSAQSQQIIGGGTTMMAPLKSQVNTVLPFRQRQLSTTTGSQSKLHKYNSRKVIGHTDSATESSQLKIMSPECQSNYQRLLSPRTTTIKQGKPKLAGTTAKENEQYLVPQTVPSGPQKQQQQTRMMGFANGGQPQSCSPDAPLLSQQQLCGPPPLSQQQNMHNHHHHRTTASLHQQIPDHTSIQAYQQSFQNASKQQNPVTQHPTLQPNAKISKRKRTKKGSVMTRSILSPIGQSQDTQKCLDHQKIKQRFMQTSKPGSLVVQQVDSSQYQTVGHPSQQLSANKPQELVYLEEVRRSFSPRYQPSKHNFKESVSVKSLATYIEANNMEPNIKTDPRYFIKSPADLVASPQQNWHQVKPKEMRVEKFPSSTKASTGHKLTRVTTAGGKLGIAKATITFTKGAVGDQAASQTPNLTKSKQMSKVSSTKAQSKQKKQLAKQPTLIKRKDIAMNPQLYAQAEHFQTAPDGSTKILSGQRDDEQRHLNADIIQEQQLPNQMSLGFGASDEAFNVEVPIVNDPKEAYATESHKAKTPLDLKYQTGNVGDWLHSEIRQKLKAKNLGHILDDPHHSTVPKPAMLSPKDLSKKEGKHLLKTASGVLSPRSKQIQMHKPMSATQSNFCRTQNFIDQQKSAENNIITNNVNESVSPPIAAQKKQQKMKKMSSQPTKATQNLQQPQKTNGVYPEEDDFLVRDSRVKEKLKMFHEKDHMKMLNTLNEQKNMHRQMTHQFSTLSPVQNYTSTNDDLYKETIEKRKIRDAIGKMSHGMKHPPVSIVEKKKQQRMINKIEHAVIVNKAEPVIDHLDAPLNSTNRGRVSLGAPVSMTKEDRQQTTLPQIDESSCRITIKTSSPSPHLRQDSISKHRRFSMHQNDETDPFFFKTTTEQLPVFEEPDQESRTHLSADGISPSKQEKIIDSASPQRHYQTNLHGIGVKQSKHKQSAEAMIEEKLLRTPMSDQESVVGNPLTKKFSHRTLDVLMRKAAKFERESKHVIQKQRILEAATQQEGNLVGLAKNFTNKGHFQKTFLRQSDAFSSPMTGRLKRQGNNMANPWSTESLLQPFGGGVVKTETSVDLSQSQNNNQAVIATVNKDAEREDQSFFMRIQRQLSQKQLLMSSTMNSFKKEPLLLYANQPQIIRRESPKKTVEPVTQSGSPNKPNEKTLQSTTNQGYLTIGNGNPGSCANQARSSQNRRQKNKRFSITDKTAFALAARTLNFAGGSSKKMPTSSELPQQLQPQQSSNQKHMRTLAGGDMSPITRSCEQLEQVREAADESQTCKNIFGEQQTFQQNMQVSTTANAEAAGNSYTSPSRKMKSNNNLEARRDLKIALRPFFSASRSRQIQNPKTFLQRTQSGNN